MAKQKQDKPKLAEVSFKDPNTVIHFKPVGFKLTAENLTIERYNQLIEMVMPKHRAQYEALFTFNNKTNELQTQE